MRSLLRVITQYPNGLSWENQCFWARTVGIHLQYPQVENKLMLIGFEDMTIRGCCQKLTNLEVFSTTRNLPRLRRVSYYHHQLIGLKVWQEQESWRTEGNPGNGANDCLRHPAEGLEELHYSGYSRCDQKKLTRSWHDGSAAARRIA